MRLKTIAVVPARRNRMKLMPDRYFANDAQRIFAGLYPEVAGKFTHRLAEHPLFEFEALAQLASRMRPCDVEQNLAALPIGVDPAALRDNGLSIVETIRSIEHNGSWLVLKFVEQDPTYRELLDAVLDELAPAVASRTGPMLKREAFIFVSSPNATTPFHFDPEHNILLQLRGEKVMTVFPAGDEEVAAPEEHERFHLGGHRNLPYDETFGAKGCAHTLRSGEAIYVPVKAPHWVRNGPAPSVSFSVTWRSEWSYREASAHGLNNIMRRAGLNPSAPERFPRQNHVKSLAYRAVDKARRAIVRS
ncbi:MAG: transcriptional regulator [Sphingomonas bacterium]|nr:transcriptional regulator [Sphingomonas bacterium]